MISEITNLIDINQTKWNQNSPRIETPIILIFSNRFQFKFLSPSLDTLQFFKQISRKLSISVLLTSSDNHLLVICGGHNNDSNEN